MLKKIIDLLAGSLNIDKSTLTIESGPGTVQEWDSLAMLNIISLVEEEFNIEMTLEEIIAIGNIGDILTILNNADSRKPDTSDYNLIDSLNQNYDLGGVLLPNQVFTGIGSLVKLPEIVHGKTLVVTSSSRHSRIIQKKLENC